MKTAAMKAAIASGEARDVTDELAAARAFLTCLFTVDGVPRKFCGWLEGACAVFTDGDRLDVRVYRTGSSHFIEEGKRYIDPSEVEVMVPAAAAAASAAERGAAPVAHAPGPRLTKAAMSAAIDGGDAVDVTEALASKGAFVACVLSRGAHASPAAVGPAGAALPDGRVCRVFRMRSDGAAHHFLMGDEAPAYPPSAVEVLALEP